MERAEIRVEFESFGILPTPQRLEIAEILFEKPQHLSAEQIIGRLRARGSGVSKATVYNTLNLFGDRGLARECFVDAERTFYDSNTEPHHHFYNIDTGHLTDIPLGKIKLERMPEFPKGAHLDQVEVLIKVRNRPRKDFP
jgi:Fur family iron response transcriptional regulator